MYFVRLAPDEAGVEYLGGDMPAAVLLVVTTFRARTADPLPEAPSEIEIQQEGLKGGRRWQSNATHVKGGLPELRPNSIWPLVKAALPAKYSMQ